MKGDIKRLDPLEARQANARHRPFYLLPLREGKEERKASRKFTRCVI